ncbi:MAG: glycosyl hydrolase 2 galactose-binding domain-containing protein [Solirubrobacterales bacterium]
MPGSGASSGSAMPSPEPTIPARVRVAAHARQLLSGGWEVARCAPGAHSSPETAAALEWMAAAVPGTAAAALRDAEVWRLGDDLDFDAEDWWFRIGFEAAPAVAGEVVRLRLDGVATVAEVFLNGELILSSDSMFAAHRVDVGERLLAGRNELAIRCRALAPLLGSKRKPRARWRTRLADGRLRFFRTMLLGRAPGFAPGPAAVGPWRPVWLERMRRLEVEGLELRTRLEGEDGILAVAVRLKSIGAGGAPSAVSVEVEGGEGLHRGELRLRPDGAAVSAEGEVRIPGVRRWWPHTHGEPALYGVRLLVGDAEGELAVDAGRVGFRELAAGGSHAHRPEEDGLDLHCNGVRVFCRGAVWTPPDFASLAAGEGELRTALEQVREAGMNMLRIPGTAAYECPGFHDLCDELGILVWQDFMFANMDYPIADEEFRAAVESETEAVLAELGGRPSLAVLCGNSEIEQQVAMLGLDPAEGRGELFGELLPRAIAAAAVDAVYFPSAPCGGRLPFRPGSGIANYYGVGGYRLPLADARRAGVRFAAECLAFANVPDQPDLEAILPEGSQGVAVHHPRWKAGVPRDAGSGWDFDDVRDHYLQALFGLDPGELRRCDHDRYLELSRAVSGEAMAAVLGEWRRAGSPCGGGLVLWLRDLLPGAGWGLLSSAGNPKRALHHLRRALAPQAVWLTDEGLAGVAVHVANDRPEPLRARLRIALYKDGELLVGEADEELELEPHSGLERDLEQMLGRFADASWAYRFGPPAQDAIFAALENPADGRLISHSVHFPARRPLERETCERLGLTGELAPVGCGGMLLRLESARLVYGLRISAPGMSAEDDAFSLEPGRPRAVGLHPRGPETATAAVSLAALNMSGSVTVRGGS